MNSRFLFLWSVVAAAFVHHSSLLCAANVRVALARVPEGGIQPQSLRDELGTLHLLYYRGDPRQGELVYTQRAPGAKEFARPFRVNDTNSSAMAIGTIRGGQFSLGKDHRVHVIWNGGDNAKGRDHPGSPLLYARMNDTQSGFEPARDLLGTAAGLDGGSSVASDREGNVYVAWHASKPGNTLGEAGRAVFISHSKDEGRTFSEERPASLPDSGVCACCGIKVFAGNNGQLALLYRSALQMTNRDEILLLSRDYSRTFQLACRDPWVVSTCPMSSASITAAGQSILAAWESRGRCWFSRIDENATFVLKQVGSTEGIRSKHPVAIQNREGDILFVWTEGTAWEKGGSVAWQLYNRAGQPIGEKGKADGVPVWSFATAHAEEDGSFSILF